MQVQRPQFRPDLIAKPVTVAGTRLFELQCPTTGKTLRFSEDGYSLAYLLDGKRSLSAVALELHKQRGVVLSIDKLSSMLEHLDVLGCLVKAPSCDPNMTVPYNAVLTVALPVLGDGGFDEALATVALRAEAFKEYYTIVPDGAAAIAPVASAPKPAKVPAPRVKAKSSPPPIPKAVAAKAKAKAPVLPELPPLPAWPPLENSIRQAALAVQAPSTRHSEVEPSSFPLVQPGQHFEVRRAHPRAARAAREQSLLGTQSLWLASGFFAAALIWASWALFRLA